MGINGLKIKDFGGPGFNNLEVGAICYELSKGDQSAAAFFLVHNLIGTIVIDMLGNDE